MMRLPTPLSLRFPRAGRSFQGPVTVSAAVHVAVVLLLVWATSRPAASPPPGTGGRPAGGGLEPVAYFTLPDFRTPAPPDQTRPRRPASQPVARVEMQDVTPTASLADAIPLAAPAGNFQVSGLGGLAGSAGSGGSARPGGAGPGSASEVFPPQARYSILPPLPAPASVRGMKFRVHFWVSPGGQVTRVEVTPSIPDAEYRKLFIRHMYEYTFAPALRPDGTPVAGETVLTITL